MKLKAKIRTNIFVKIAIFTILVFSAITIVKMQFEINKFKENKQLLENKIDESNNRIEELSNQISIPFDDNYVIRVAKEKLNYGLPEEIIFYNDLVK